MSRLRRFSLALVAFVVLLALVAGAVVLVGGKQQQLEAAPRVSTRPLAVRSVAVAHRPWLETREVPARLEVHEAIELAPRITASVATVPVETGDTVAAGQVLVALDAAELESQVATARAAVAAADSQRQASAATLGGLRSTLRYWQDEDERHQRLLGQDGVSQAQAAATREQRDAAAGRLDAAEAAVAQRAAEAEAARARLAEAELQRSWAVLVAPRAGVVARRLADPGDQAQAGQPLLTLLPARRRLWLDLPPADLQQVTVDQLVYAAQAQTTVEIEARPIARVVAIHPAVDAMGLIRVEAELMEADDHGPAVGSTRLVRLLLARHPAAAMVPHEALVPTPEGGWAVFSLDAGRLRPIRVQRLGEDGAQVACTGLKAGTRVVLSGYLGWNRLSAGLEAVERP